MKLTPPSLQVVASSTGTVAGASARKLSLCNLTIRFEPWALPPCAKLASGAAAPARHARIGVYAAEETQRAIEAETFPSLTQPLTTMLPIAPPQEPRGFAIVG